MNHSRLNPAKLRLILIACLVLLVGAGGGVFMVGYNVLADYSAKARTTAAEAQASNSSLQNLIVVKRELAEKQDTVERASQIVAASKSYVYQDQIIRDINNFANNAGLSVTNITFADAKVTPTTPSATTSSSPTTANNSSAAATGNTSAVPSGVKSMTATVTLKNPVDYNAMLRFIHSIEGSLFKMRISQVTLSRPADAKGNEVTSDVLTIEVYVR